MFQLSEFSSEQRQRLGSLLVVLQFGLLAWLSVLAAGPVFRGQLTWVSVLLAALSMVLGGWTLLHNRLGNFNIHPAPKPQGVLVLHGPYRWIRHPMYSAVLLGAAALAVVPATWFGGLLWLALALVLLLKSSVEESWLCAHYPPYAAYCQRSKRFVPWVF